MHATGALALTLVSKLKWLFPMKPVHLGMKTVGTCLVVTVGGAILSPPLLAQQYDPLSFTPRGQFRTWNFLQGEPTTGINYYISGDYYRSGPLYEFYLWMQYTRPQADGVHSVVAKGLLGCASETILITTGDGYDGSRRLTKRDMYINMYINTQIVASTAILQQYCQ